MEVLLDNIVTSQALNLTRLYEEDTSLMADDTGMSEQEVAYIRATVSDRRTFLDQSIIENVSPEIY